MTQTKRFVPTSFADGSVKILCEKLSLVVQEHFQSLALQQDDELQSLRAQVIQFRGQHEKFEKESLAPHEIEIDSQTPCEVGPTSDILKDVSKKTLRFDDDVSLDQSKELPVRAPTSVSFTNNDSFDDTLEAPSTKAGPQLLPTPQPHGRSLEHHDLTIMDVKHIFNELDCDCTGYIDVNQFANLLTMDVACDSQKKEQDISRYKRAIQELNSKFGALAHDSNLPPPGQDHLYFPAFQALVLEDVSELYVLFGTNEAQAIIEIRNLLIKDFIAQQVAIHHGVSREMVDRQTTPFMLKNTSVLNILEPISAVVIILNALTSGVSLDISPEWGGWFVFEVCFTCFFVIEFAICLYVRGCAAHFFGEAWYWAWFDFFIVFSSVSDTAINWWKETGSEQADDVDLNQLLILRIGRLFRVTRIIRVFKIFKELTLMLHGVIAGLRTLFWAIFFLVIFMYVLGVFMRQMMLESLGGRRCKLHPTDADGTAVCNSGEIHLRMHGHTMFRSVPRSMLTMFMCFMDGCAGPDGTPLIWHLWESHGSLIVLMYVASFLFICFGVLNLICAVFVENTIKTAQRDDLKREFGSDQHGKARALQKLVSRLCTHEVKGLHFYPDGSIDHTISHRLHLRVSKEQFERVMEDEQVQNLLDDLDVTDVNRARLFDILDSDGNGYLSVNEFVSGITRIRGPADKSDSVAAVLLCQQLQKQLSKFEHHARLEFNAMQAIFRQPSSSSASLQAQENVCTI